MTGPGIKVGALVGLDTALDRKNEGVLLSSKILVWVGTMAGFKSYQTYTTAKD